MRYGILPLGIDEAKGFCSQGKFLLFSSSATMMSAKLRSEDRNMHPFQIRKPIEEIRGFAYGIAVFWSIRYHDYKLLNTCLRSPSV